MVLYWVSGGQVFVVDSWLAVREHFQQASPEEPAPPHVAWFDASPEAFVAVVGETAVKSVAEGFGAAVASEKQEDQEQRVLIEEMVPRVVVLADVAVAAALEL